jgi:arylsulfatase A-like enzyme
MAGLLTACGEREAPPRLDFAAARPGPVIRLVDREAEISGEVRGEDAVIERWSGERLEPWALRPEEAVVRFASPALERIPNVGAIELEIAPGGADRLELTPTMWGDQGASLRRARRIELALEQNLPPDVAVRLHVDVKETLAGNWGDTVHEPGLTRLEIALHGADPASVRLESVRLLRDEVALPFAARRAVAEVGGRLHPSWWVRRGSAVSIAVDLPAGAPELRWFAGALESGEAPRVEVVSGGAAVVLDDSLDGPAWQARRASLARFAQQRATLRLSNVGSGIALFGDPRIVVPTGGDRPTDVLVYLIDTLRADHVGALGARQAGITPNLDRLIAHGFAFEMALSHSPWTKPAVTTLLTGLLPTTHRVGSRTLSDRVPASVPMLQERFRNAGWRTGSFAANPLGSTLTGLERGFGTTLAPRFWRRRPALGRHPSALQLRTELLRWVDAEPDRPFFAYVHVMEVHPSGRRYHGRASPEGFTEYAAAVRAADADLGALLDALAERGRLDDLLLVVVADHGDSFGEHGRPFRGHGTSLFQDQIHVPLVLWHRAVRRAPVRRPVGLADVTPTLIEWFGLPPLPDADGIALGADGAAPGVARTIPSALIRYPHAPEALPQHAIVDPDRVKALRIGDEAPRVYDLREDPAETGEPVSAATERVLRDLERSIEATPPRAKAFDARHGPSHAGALDAETIERLRELGYIR